MAGPSGKKSRRVVDPVDEMVGKMRQLTLSEENMRAVKDFLDANKVTAGWEDFIISNARIRERLLNGIKKLDELVPFLPEKGKILNALRFCRPNGIKLVIIGEDPIPNRTLVTGLAFSAPHGTRSTTLTRYRGQTFIDLHEVLEAVGINVDGYCLQPWARDGVLLLNAVLAVDEQIYADYKRMGKTSKEYWAVRMAHKAAWIEFTKRLLLELLRSRARDLPYIFCWGDNAKEISEFLHGKFYRIFVSHHPTFPKSPEPNDFKSKAKEQFTAVNGEYPKLLNTKTKAINPKRA